MRYIYTSLLLLALSVTVAQGQYYPRAWVDLFQPPYENCPEIMMSIGCVSSGSCYVPGGSNGVGFGVYNFDGQYNGNFVPMNQIDNSPIDFTLQVGVGGTADQPKGAVGGMGLFLGLKYFVNSTTLAPALTLPFTETMDISTDRSGNTVLFVDGFSGTPSLMHSTDAGVTYDFVTVDTKSIPDPNCTIPTYQTIADTGVWYVIASGQPPSHNSGSSSSSDDVSVKRGQRDRSLIRLNSHTAILRKGADLSAVLSAGWIPSKKNPQMVRRSAIKHLNSLRSSKVGSSSGSGSQCGYSAAILSTTDAGKTWSTFNFDTTSWTLYDIDCANATHCVAVGSGYEDVTSPKSVIVGTTDGKTWKEILSIPATATSITLLASVRFNPANKAEVWVAGGLDTEAGGYQGVFYYSRDGGATWHKHGAVNFLADVMQMSFTQDGNGFAVGITQFDDSTILRYTMNGPPATPAPSWLGNFSQIQCEDDACSQNCTVFSFPQNTCLNLTGGGSAKAACDMTDQVLMQNFFPLDTVCWGPAAPEPMPLNQCVEGSNGGSFVTICGPVTAPPGTVSREGGSPMVRKQRK